MIERWYNNIEFNQKLKHKEHILMKKISVVVPCYNEEEAVPIYYKHTVKILRAMNDIDYEIIFVNDGSKDNTISEIKKLAEIDKNIFFVDFSRNFGKESAMYAGLSYATGDYVALMDVDLQDPPEFIPKMYREIIENGYDCVGTRRVTRKGEPVLRSFFARCFYKLINKISETEIVDGARDFRLMTRQMIDSILELKEYNRFSKGLFSWVGFKTKWLEYENVERVAGETKWSFWKLLLYSLDGIVAFSTAPLAISSVLGIVCCLLAFLFICVIVIKTIILGDPVGGYPSMACFILFIGGLQLFAIGILGQYLSKTYLESKRRPIFIARETNIKKED